MSSVAHSVLDRVELALSDSDRDIILEDATYSANINSSSDENSFFGRSCIDYSLYFSDGSRFSYTEFLDGLEPLFANFYASDGAY